MRVCKSSTGTDEPLNIDREFPKTVVNLEKLWAKSVSKRFEIERLDQQ